MTPEVVNLTCPGCGAPLSAGIKECDSCGRPLIIQSFKTFIDLNPVQTNNYSNEYRKILSTDPYNPEVNKALGLALLKLNMYDQATKMLDNASTFNPVDSDAFFFAGIAQLGGKRPAFVKRNQINEAIQKIEAAKMIESKPIYDYVLALIKYDYFYRKGFSITPNFKDHEKSAYDNGFSNSEKEELNAILKFNIDELPPVE